LNLTFTNNIANNDLEMHKDDEDDDGADAYAIDLLVKSTDLLRN
jgi:hypothetical protein